MLYCNKLIDRDSVFRLVLQSVHYHCFPLFRVGNEQFVCNFFSLQMLNFDCCFFLCLLMLILRLLWSVSNFCPLFVRSLSDKKRTKSGRKADKKRTKVGGDRGRFSLSEKINEKIINEFH